MFTKNYKKLIIFFLIFGIYFLHFKLVYGEWDVSALVYDNINKTFNSSMNGFTFKSDGTKIYTVNFSSKYIIEWDLSTPWNILSASTSLASKSVSAQGSPQTIELNSDGTKMFFIEFYTDRLYEYNLTTPWSVVSGVYSSKSYSFMNAHGDGNPYGGVFAKNGERYFEIDSFDTRIYQYNLSTAYDLSTMSFPNKSFLCQPTKTCFYGRAPVVSNDGSQMIFITDDAYNNGSEALRQLSFGTNYEANTLSTVPSKVFSLTNQTSNPYGVYVKPDGSKIYVGDSNGKIFQYSMTSTDTESPTITSISSDTANGSYKAGSVIDIDILFSENVNSTGEITVTLETGSTDRTCTVTVTNSSMASCNYTVQSGDVSSDLSATVSGVISDVAGNTMASFTPITSLQSNKNIVIDTEVPTILSISSDKANGSYKAGEVIDIDVTFSENITSTGNITVTLETGSVDQTCVVSATNTSTVTCNYTVQSGDNSSDLNASISGVINDVAGNTLVNFTPTTGLSSNKNLKIDTVKPTILSVSSDKSSANYVTGDSIDIDVTVSESVSGTITVTLETGSTDRTCDITFTNSSTGSCNYIVSSGDTSSDLSASISGTLEDQALNQMTDFNINNNLSENKDITINQISVSNIFNFNFSKTSQKNSGEYKYGSKVKVTSNSTDQIFYQWVKGFDNEYSTEKWTTLKGSLFLKSGKYSLFVKSGDTITKEQINTESEREIYSVKYNINRKSKIIKFSWKIKGIIEIGNIKIFRTNTNYNKTLEIGKNKKDDNDFSIKVLGSSLNYKYTIVVYDTEGKKINSVQKIINVRF